MRQIKALPTLRETLLKLIHKLIVAFVFLSVGELHAEVPSNIRVGATVPLTGPLAATGVHIARGLELASQQINAQGGIQGRKLLVVVEDNAGEPKRTASAAVKLLEADRVQIIFSAFTHLSSAIKERVKRSGALYFYLGAVKAVAQENPRAFRDWGDAYSQGAIMAREALRLKKGRIAIATEENEATKDFINGVKDTIQGSGIQIVFEEIFLPDETDYRSALLRVRSTTPDLFLLGAWRNSALIQRQMKTLGLITLQTFEILGPLLPANNSAEMLALKEENKAVSFWYDFGFDSGTESQRDFVRDFTEKFNEPPRIEAAFAFDDLKLLAARAANCPMQTTLDRDCIARGIRNSSWNGVAGLLEFGSEGLATREEILVEVREGKWVKRR